MSKSGSALEDWISRGAGTFDRYLGDLLDSGSAGRSPGTGHFPRLAAAMRHAVLAGGKRLRPYLALQSAILMGVEGEGPKRVAAALEYVHCYSLVHDDLPAMDDDDIRRGQPTVHRAFDEATAILAGDGLLTLAFGVIAGKQTSPSTVVRCRLIEALARAAGIDGMVGGQMLDLEAEGRFGNAEVLPLDMAAIERLQNLKTGALFVFAAEAGALQISRPAKGARPALAAYGRALGLAFQIRDDLIDVEIDAETAGKATGKDQALGKGTFVSLLGLDGARRRLEQITSDGLAALQFFGPDAEPLAEVLIFNLNRRS